MKQFGLFGNEAKEDEKYTQKVGELIYKPRGQKPHIMELYDKTKAVRIINRIKASNIPDDIKLFLQIAAYRHTVFNYTKIADFYAHSDKEVQELFETSALVIIDFEKAIQHGFAVLNEKVIQTVLTDNEKS